MKRERLVHLALVLLALAPAAELVWGAWRDSLGANPIETITHTTGDWALRLLLVTLAVTPLRRVLGWRALAPYRRTFGLLTFTYACLHFSTYLVDQFFDWELIVEDVIERPYITVGFTGFLCLLPLAITSTRGWMRRLRRRWSQLHRLAYVAAIAGVIHFLWQVKADTREPLIYAAVLAVLFGVRAWYAWGPATAVRRPAR